MIDTKINGNTIYTTVTGKLVDKDYDALIPQLEAVVNKYKKIKWYFEMKEFEGWELGALWRDLKMDVKYVTNLEKIAMVSDKQWEKWLTQIMKPFTSAETKYFPLAGKEEAKSWIAA